MTEFLMLVRVEKDFKPTDRLDLYERTIAWVDESDGSGVRIFGSRLAPTEEATTIRVRDNAVHTETGSVDHAAEPIGGFDILRCAGLDEAIEIASRHPMAKHGAIELRKLF